MTATDDSMDLTSGIAAFEAREFARAGQILGPLAEGGDADAQFRLAIMCQNGLGRVKNEADAFKWMQVAAGQGHALAQHGLGFMYLEGECAQADPEKAAEWFQKASEQGLAGSQTTLASMYKEGRGVGQDLERARQLYEAAGFDPDEL